MGDETMSTGDPICPICGQMGAHFHNPKPTPTFADLTKVYVTDNETITESDIWADIDKVFCLPEREPGDLGIKQFMDRYGISETSARRRMNKLVETGEWEWIAVSDDTCNNGMRKVVRKVK